MELTILGSGTSIPSLKRASPGYLLSAGSTLALLDPGPGTLRRVLEAGSTIEAITHVLCSHTHVDHTADLAALLFASRNPAAPRRDPLTVAGSREFLAFLEDLSRIHGTRAEASPYDLTLAEVGERPALFGDLEVAACPVPHTASSVALRLTDMSGRTLVYSGDTDHSDALVDLARRANLLLIEASFPDEERVEGHLTPSLAGRIADRARPGLVLLTHFYPSCERADMLGQLRRTWDGGAAIAEDMMRIEV